MSTVVSDGLFKVELDFLITAAKVVNLRLLNAFFVSLLLSLMARVGFFYETESDPVFLAIQSLIQGISNVLF